VYGQTGFSRGGTLMLESYASLKSRNTCENPKK
jgi:hypothetical protein